MTALSDRLAEARKQQEAQENAANMEALYKERSEAARALIDEILKAHGLVYMLDDTAEKVADFDVNNFDVESADELNEILEQTVSVMRGEPVDSDDNSVESEKARKPHGFGKKLEAFLNRIP